jgi:Fe-S-cluster containining protein
MLTLGDIKRLTKHFGYPGMTKFLEAECVWAEVTEPKEIYTLGLPPCNVKYAGYYLKRFKEENEATIEKPHRCRFLTVENLCRIQKVKPVVCTKFPYTVQKDLAGIYHAYYVDVPWSRCQGYQEKKKIKKKWLSEWVKPLIDGAEEVYETLKNNLMLITEID